MESSNLKKIAIYEIGLFSVLLFAGFVVMPVAIYFVGQLVFGSYGDAGYAHFFNSLSEKVRSGDPVAWFLVLSPWLGWQCLRLAATAWKAATPR